MTADKLSKWLSGQGLLGGSKKSSTTSSDSSIPKKVETKTSEKSSASSSAKPTTAKKPFVKKAPYKKTNSNYKGNKSGGKVPHWRKKVDFDDPKNRTKSDPTFHRPTFEKREKYHPTNFIKGGAKGDIRIVPIGGMEQVGMNMMFIEWGDEILVIDTGLIFPGQDDLGVDALIPDIEYLKKNKHKIKGLIYTHGHLDHIGGAPYMVPDLGYPPIYTGRLTKELLLAVCDEHLDTKRLKINELTPKSKLKLGKFEVEFFHINHSIPDGLAIVVKTPYGSIIHTSDFKIDHNPSDDQPADLGRIAEVGKDGVLVAMIDSTNAMKTGQTVSERVIAAELGKIIKEAPGRVVLSTFASSIGRVAKVIEAAEEDGRTVYLSGRSMERNMALARKLNYLKCKDKTLQLISDKANKADPKKVLILSTGSQGESLAALTRMAAGSHPKIKLRKEDTVVFASSPIPGNELAIVQVLNNLAEIGCKVINHKNMNTHVSGHGNAEECKLMCALLNPKYFAPIHGEVFMRYAHKDLMINDLGFKEENCFIMKNGLGLVANDRGLRMAKDSEIIPQRMRLIQLGEDVHDQVMEDRKFISEYGIVIAKINHKNGKIDKIDFRSRAFLYRDKNHSIFKMIEAEIKRLWDKHYDPARPDSALENMIQKSISNLIYKKFRKNTVIEVII